MITKFKIYENYELSGKFSFLTFLQIVSNHDYHFILNEYYTKMYKYFRNFLDYHKYYYAYDNYRFGETWGGLRSFRNILPQEYQFEKDMDLTVGKHAPS